QTNTTFLPYTTLFRSDNLDVKRDVQYLARYEWEGEPHNSPSIKRDHTGQVVARNLVPNSSFELGLNGVTATRNLLLSRTTVSDRVVSGDWSFWPRAQQDITHLSYVRQEVTGLAGGGWLAFRAALRATTGSAREARLRVGFSDGGSRVYEWITSHTNVV